MQVYHPSPKPRISKCAFCGAVTTAKDLSLWKEFPKLMVGCATWVTA